MKIILIIALLIVNSLSFAQRVGVGTPSPDPSAQLDVSSTNKGFLAPRMTTAQRDAIANPAMGLMIVNTTTNAVEFFDGTSWLNLVNAVRGAAHNRVLLGGTFGESPWDFNTASDGSYYLTGSVSNLTGGTVVGLPSYGPSDIYLAKFDPNGTMQWQKTFGGASTDIGRSVQPTADGGCILASFSNSTNSGTMTGINSNGGTDFHIMKLDPAGTITWQKYLGGAGVDEVYRMISTADGGYMIAGQSTSSNTGTLTGLTNNGAQDFLAIKTDANGNVQWQKMLGGSLADNLADVRQTIDGGYVLGGYTTSSNTGTLTGLNNNGTEDYLVIKLDGSGNTVWQKMLGGTANDNITSLSATADGGILVSGFANSSNTGTLAGMTNNGAADFWILKLDFSGTIQWQKLIGGLGSELWNRVISTTDGGSLVMGQSNSSNTGTLAGLYTSGSYDLWMVKLDASGNILWQKLHGGNDTESIVGIKQLSDGGFLVGGSTNSSNSGVFAGLFNYGSSDMFVLRFDKNGNVY